MKNYGVNHIPTKEANFSNYSDFVKSAREVIRTFIEEEVFNILGGLLKFEKEADRRRTFLIKR